LHFDLSEYIRDDPPRPARASPKEQVLYNKWGKAVYRLCGTVLYDYRGRPRGFIVGTTVYDLRAEHRGFWQNLVVSDRMRRVIGFAPGACIKGLVLPLVEIPPLAYRDLPAPALPDGATELECTAFVPIWSMMQFENLLPSFDDDETEKESL
jgi:hypothetical protein